MLHCGKLICSSELFFREVDILKSSLLANSYPEHFFGKKLPKFLALSSLHTQKNANSDDCETCFLKVPYIGPASKQFTKCLSQLVYREFGLKLRVVYATFKINLLLSAKNKNTAWSLVQSCAPVSMFVWYEPCLRWHDFATSGCKSQRTVGFSWTALLFPDFGKMHYGIWN